MTNNNSAVSYQPATRPFKIKSSKSAHSLWDKTLPPDREIIINDTVDTKIYSTYDYDKFKKIEGNRPIKSKDLHNLIHAMSKHDSKVPVLVTKNFDLIDGQHRVAARKALMLPVYYVITDMPATARTIIDSTRAQKSFSPTTVATLYAAEGNVEYQKVIEFTQKFSITMSTAVALVTSKKTQSGVTSIGSAFSEGDFIATNLQEAEELMTYVEELHRASKYHPTIKHRHFIFALKECMKVKGFDREIFLKNANKFSYLFDDRANINQYRDLINTIYNKSIYKKLNINLKSI